MVRGGWWVLWLLVLGLAPSAAAARPAPVLQERLRVYLDCNDCFQDFLRSEIQWVDFVRDPKDSDVQVLSSSRETGGGGREIVLRLVGLGRFANQEQELRAISVAADTEDLRRRRVLDVVNVGLLGLSAREGLPGDLRLNVAQATGRTYAQPTDSWNHWVFRVSGDGSLESEETARERSWEFDATADRVTDAWKIAIGVSLEGQRQTFDLDEEDPVEVARREREFEWFAAKSLGEHWSAGVDGRVMSSTFTNTRRRIEGAPAIEFNLFPYSQYASRQLRIEYAAGFEHSEYNEITLFEKLEETLGKHELSVTLDQREPWGTIQAGAEWSQYLHDLSKSRFEVEGELSFRLARGLSLQVEGSASRIRDQISLPRRGATPEEVLLRVRQLQSGHEVRFTVGGAYSFGSIFNNIVNPRFGGR